MQRLVYSPKVFVYVEVSEPFKLPGRLPSVALNLSDYVISGEVSRKIDQVSTATIQLRNPNRIFTPIGNPAFTPMDKITIFMERLPGHTIQVFTGYLDSVPYYQMYPGPCTLTASCTLKRLLHTYFDPALPFMQEFMRQYGWVNRGGQLVTAHSLLGKAIQGLIDDGLETSNVNPQATDSSIGTLLFATLKHIGGWDAENIWIEQLPENLPKTVAKIYDKEVKNQEVVEEQLTRIFTDIIGQGSAGSGDGGSGGVPYDGPFNKTFPRHFNDSPGNWVQLTEDQVAQIAEHAGLPGKTFAQIAHGESNFYPGVEQHDPGDGNIGYGLWQMTPHAWGTGSAAYRYMQRLGGIPAMFNPWKNALMARFLYDSAGKTIKPWYGTTYVDMSNTNQHVRKKELDTSTKDPKKDPRANASSADSGKDAKQASQEATSKSASRNGSDSKGEYVVPWTKGNFMEERRTDMGKDMQITPGSAIVAMGSGTIHWVNGGAFGQYWVFLTLDTPIKSNIPGGGKIIYYGHAGPLWGNLKQGQHVDAGDPLLHSQKTGVFTTEGGDGHVEIGWASSVGQCLAAARGVGSDHNNTPSGIDFVKFLDAVDDGKHITTAPGGSGASGAAGSGSDGDVLQTAKAAAFSAVFDFPTVMEMTEAQLLTGNHSLMNDQPLLPFVEQLCKGSMRHFQSMPNGNFYAFFADYFGGFGNSDQAGGHKPYWEIDDVEILEGNIELSDEALATHVYVWGDTLQTGLLGGNEYTEMIERTSSTGVTSVFSEGPSDYIKGTKGEPLFESTGATLNFLRRYGARPVVQEAPFVRSHWFETFMSFQTFMLLWARQFLTTFTFTFMPEVFPGGIVSFPSHGIQCYVDEVHHSFDYTGGFTTRANLSAPAALKGAKNEISRGLVRRGTL